MAADLSAYLYDLVYNDPVLYGSSIPNRGEAMMTLLLLESEPKSEPLLAYIWKVCPWYAHTGDDEIAEHAPEDLPLVQLVRRIAGRWGYTDMKEFDKVCRRSFDLVVTNG